jgi:hypothetical protein
MTLGTLSARTAPSSLITKNIPGTNERLPVIGLGTNRWVAAGDNMLAAHGELPDAGFRTRQKKWFASL